MKLEQLKHLMERFNQEPDFREAVRSHNPHPGLWQRLLNPPLIVPSYKANFTLDPIQAQMHGLEKDFQIEAGSITEFPLSSALALSKLPFSDVNRLRENDFGVWPSLSEPDRDLLRIMNPDLDGHSIDFIMGGVHPKSVPHIEDIESRQWGALWFDPRHLASSDTATPETNLIPNIFEVLSAVDSFRAQQGKDGNLSLSSSNEWVLTSSRVQVDLKKEYRQWLKDRGWLAEFFHSAILERYVPNGSEINNIIAKEEAGGFEHKKSRPLRTRLNDGSNVTIFEDHVLVQRRGETFYERISDDYMSINTKKNSWSLRMGTLEIQDYTDHTRHSFNFDEEILDPLRRLLGSHVAKSLFTTTQGINLWVCFRLGIREGLSVGMFVPSTDAIPLNEHISISLLDGAFNDLKLMAPALNHVRKYVPPAIYRDQDARRLLD